MSFRTLLLSCAVALALAGCGVKGPLEPPPGADPSAPQPSAAPQTSLSTATTQAGEAAWGANPQGAGGINPPDMPGNSVSKPATGTTATKKSFFLDFLL